LNILIFNCGSSSLSFKIFAVKEHNDIEEILKGKVHRVGVKGIESSFIEYSFKEKVQKEILSIKNHRDAANIVFKYLRDTNLEIDCIGHRFVHGGEYFKKSVFIDKDILRKLQLCLPLAPLHNSISLDVIYECKKLFSKIPQYATFDSVFHSSIPDYAYTYALPKKIIQKFGFRKYGFHGLSYSYITKKVSTFLKTPLKKLRIIACHLGTGGSSVSAIRDGRSIDTSMGYSPLSGLVMSTRSGDIDPMLMIYLMTTYDYRPEELMDILNKKSGLLGISGFSSDIRDIIKNLSGKEKEYAELAFKMYVHRLKKYIGSYVVVLEGIDVLVFTDDIGVQNYQVRERVCENMEWCGIMLDKKLNRQADTNKVSSLNSEQSKVLIFSIPTDEEFVIVSEGIKLLKDKKNDSNL